MSIREFGVMGLYPDEEILKSEMKIHRAEPKPMKFRVTAQDESSFRNDYMKQRNIRKENVK